MLSQSCPLPWNIPETDAGLFMHPSTPPRLQRSSLRAAEVRSACFEPLPPSPSTHTHTPPTPCTPQTILHTRFHRNRRPRPRQHRVDGCVCVCVCVWMGDLPLANGEAPRGLHHWGFNRYGYFCQTGRVPGTERKKRERKRKRERWRERERERENMPYLH